MHRGATVGESSVVKPLRFYLLLAVLVAAPILAAGETLVMGVFAFRPKEIMAPQYAHLADYLTRSVPGLHVDLQVLPQEEIEARLAAGTLDLVLTNPSHFVVLRQRSRLTGAIATMVSLEKGVGVSVLGGVVLVPMGRDDIRELRDLRGKRIVVPGAKYLGGYQAQAYELLREGVRLPDDAEIEIVGSHDGVVAALLAGKADAGFVRTGVVEAMAREGRLPPDRLKVLNPRQYAGFPFLCSTELYPEWAFTALPHVNQSTVRQIARALLNIEADSPVAKAVGIAGFTIPGDYVPVENLARALRLPPFEGVPEFTPRDIWTRYRRESLASLSAGTLILLLAAGLFVSHRRLKRATVELRRVSQRHELLLGAAGEGIFGTDRDGNITFVNPAALDALGYDMAELIGRRAQTLFVPRDEVDANAAKSETLLEVVLHEMTMRRGDATFVRKSGARFPVHLIVTAMVEEGEHVGAEVVFQDVTDRKILEEDLIRQATMDSLTGAANRRHFLSQVETEWSRIRRKGGTAALVLIDLDRFKAINDSAGHGAGDAVLKAFARVVRESLRRFDLFGRLGGDEFAILLPDSDLAGARSFCERLRADVAAITIEHGERKIGITVSMGLALMTRETANPDETITQADSALYDAKAHGRNRIAVAEAAISASTPGR